MATETRWNAEVAAALAEAAGELPDTRLGKMFGYPALYASGKMFACAYGRGVGLKLPAAVVAELVEEKDFEPFQPYGRARMREWVFLEAHDKEAVRARSHLLREAARFVAGKALPVGDLAGARRGG